MSVAFRRESDEEHKEPRFELPLPAGPNIVTPRGLRLICDQVLVLEQSLAADPAEPESRQRELRYWNTRAATAELAPPPPEGEVAIGTRVHFRLDGAERTIDIVGADEADPAAQRIGFAAPLAQAMIGAESGDTLPFNDRPEAIEILAAFPIPAEDDA
ncbi:GreA/GreB family transcription elongation factor [Hephaestia caeni]|uniref:GreA/GreB family transcription elongation factor n=1 Tax=Hephaestia caeni TaxID=645617 RepID=A0A397PI75_9SPHN|nr:GreA/GreB family elongation factor [Hephaestia caeni]RIA45844.1 GreA/GreB family transcription elongation factor [Hephaestia caeni]